MVSLLSTSSVMVLPVRVFTKICMFFSIGSDERVSVFLSWLG
jgi:hypothetical protein